MKVHAKLLHTVLSVATLNIPGIETPAPPPMAMPFKRATCMEIIITVPCIYWVLTNVVIINRKLMSNILP